MATMGIQSEIVKIAQTYGIKLSGVNPYTNLSPQDITNKWEAVSTTHSGKPTEELKWFSILIVLPSLARFLHSRL